ncbi:MAG: hypothetical protein PHY48_11545 [Candidatus Cloacimonetes bacterium]|nr:hypothetical protein [Candidatus Cloacimonadota bacterium]
MEEQLNQVRDTYLGTTAVEYRGNAGAQARMRQGIQKLADTARELAAADTREIVESFGKQGARRFTLAA